MPQLRGNDSSSVEGGHLGAGTLRHCFALSTNQQMARTSKTAAGRAGDGVVAPVVKTKSAAKSKVAAKTKPTAKATKTRPPSNVVVKMKTTKKQTPKNRFVAAAEAAEEKGETATSQRRALGKINPNVDEDDDSVVDESGTSKKVVTTKKTTQKKTTTQKKNKTTAAPTTKATTKATTNATKGRGHATVAAIYEEVGSDDGGEESNDDGSETLLSIDDDDDEEEESDYEETTTTKKVKTKKKNINAAPAPTRTKKNKVAPSTSSTGNTNIKKTKSTKMTGTISVLEVLNEVSSQYASNRDSIDVGIPNFTQRYTTDDGRKKMSVSSVVHARKGDSKTDDEYSTGDGGGDRRGTFDNLQGYARRPTTTFVEEYQPKDDWRCSSVCDW